MLDYWKENENGFDRSSFGMCQPVKYTVTERVVFLIGGRIFCRSLMFLCKHACMRVLRDGAMMAVLLPRQQTIDELVSS